MKFSLGLVCAMLFIAALTSCGPQAPTEAEIRAKIIGEYCADKYRLVIEDSTYRCRKFNAGIISSTPIPESCKGSYELILENNVWSIHFNKDPRPQGIKNCENTFELWNVDEQYRIGNENKIILWDLFDETPLTKGACLN